MREGNRGGPGRGNSGRGNLGRGSPGRGQQGAGGGQRRRDGSGKGVGNIGTVKQPSPSPKEKK